MDFGLYLDRLWYFGPLIWLICAVLWMIRGRFCLGSVLGGLGFLLLVLNGVLHGIWRGFEEFGWFDEPDLLDLVMAVIPYTSITFLLGQVLILTGFATTRYRASGAAAEPQYAPQSYDRDYDDRPTPQRYREPSEEMEAEWAERVEDDWEDRDRDSYGDRGYGDRDMGPPAALHEPGWALTGGWIVSSALTLLFGIVAMALVLDAGSHLSDDEMIGIVIAFALCFITGLPAIILFYVWLYRAWSAVPPEYRSASPGQAVGYMFIPFYNLYWVFRAIPGLSASTRRAQLALDPRDAGGAGYGLGILAGIVAVIPYVNILSWFFFVIWMIVANGDRNQLLRSRYAAER